MAEDSAMFFTTILVLHYTPPPQGYLRRQRKSGYCGLSPLTALIPVSWDLLSKFLLVLLSSLQSLAAVLIFSLFWWIYPLLSYNIFILVEIQAGI